MSLVAKQAYYKIERQMNSTSQEKIQEERILYLFNDRIESKHRTFPIDDVLDLSFKKVGEEGGILLLHTDHGIYSYMVHDSPQKFISICLEMISNREK